MTGTAEIPAERRHVILSANPSPLMREVKDELHREADAREVLNGHRSEFLMTPQHRSVVTRTAMSPL
jgi:hypothetical protein